MTELSYEDFKKLDEFQEFIQENSSNGKLKIQVFAGNQAMPIPNAKVKITKEVKGKEIVFYTGITDISGIIEDIDLPTPNTTYNLEKKEVPSKTNYKISIENNDFEPILNQSIGMLNNVKVLQYLKLIPKIEVI